MGGIDLDPASCVLANETVKATTFYTLEDDGMMHDWYGRVLLNPPYSGTGYAPNHSRGLFKREFIAKLEHHYLAGDVEQAILICPLNYSSKWGEPIRQSAAALCQFVKPRLVKFYSISNGDQVTIIPSQAVYFGQHIDRFYEEFKEFGLVVVPMRGN